MSRRIGWSGLLSGATSGPAGIAPEMSADGHRRSVSRWRPRRGRRGARSNVPANPLVAPGSALLGMFDNGWLMSRRGRCGARSEVFALGTSG